MYEVKIMFKIDGVKHYKEFCISSTQIRVHVVVTCLM